MEGGGYLGDIQYGGRAYESLGSVAALSSSEQSFTASPSPIVSSG
jgi:hypothetical protein